MDSSGNHVKGQFGLCSPGCPQEPVCGSLRVLDTDDDFASGLYSAARGRRSGGRPVWEDEANGFFIYWISAEAGWGLGYEENIDTGAAVYSSGASQDEEDVVNEPWLGRWKDAGISVECEELEFRDLLAQGLGVRAGLIHEEGSECEATEVCLRREQCPEVKSLYSELTTLDKKSSRAKQIFQTLREKVNFSFSYLSESNSQSLKYFALFVLYHQFISPLFNSDMQQEPSGTVLRLVSK